MNKQKKTLIEEIKKGLEFEGIYCSEYCRYKNFTHCELFNEQTGYNYKLDKPKRVKKCLYYFGKGSKL